MTTKTKTKVSNVKIKKLIHQSNLIEGFDDPTFDSQGLVAWRFLVEDVLFDQLDDHCVQKVQKIVTLAQTDLQPDWRGYYRKIPVYIGGREAIKPAYIARAMSNLLSIATITPPKTWHIEFEKIHPFVDGNGRTGRLIMWWQQMQRGEPLTEILYDERQDYYKWFKS